MEKGKQRTDLKLELETCKQQKHKVDIVDRCTILIVCLTFCTQCFLRSVNGTIFLIFILLLTLAYQTTTLYNLVWDTRKLKIGHIFWALFTPKVATKSTSIIFTVISLRDDTRQKIWMLPDKTGNKI